MEWIPMKPKRQRNKTESGPLEILCRECGGSGDTDGYGKLHRCPVCDGSGWETTEFGERVLELMRHHFRPMLQDITG